MFSFAAYLWIYIWGFSWTLVVQKPKGFIEFVPSLFFWNIKC